MQIIKMNQKKPELEIIKQAAEVLKAGGLVVYPTDTAYGLGGNALDKKVIKKVYEIKGRDFTKPTHVIVRNWQMIEQLCYPNKLAKKLYDKFLPGPLTLILPKRPSVPDILTANLPTLGVRIPNNHVTMKLSSHLSFPYTTPSANRAGEPTPYSINEVKKVLDISKVDLILNAGKLPKVLPSTIVDATNEVPKILREGPISKNEITKLL